MKRFGIGLLCGIAGYIVAALASYFLVLQLSSNMHDREMEAAMTAVFFFGPLAGLGAFIAGIVFSGKRKEVNKLDAA